MQTMHINNNYVITKMHIATFDSLTNSNYAQQNFTHAIQCEKYSNAHINAQACSYCILVKNNNTMYYLDNNNKLHKCTFAQAMQVLATTFTQL